ncbi:hypothetical protein CIP107580_01916 [Corynebacterium diphtheriae]|nr:hypothetical protein CIP107533_01938 [Corynebacterium diphtheriae]CAB0662838.1 hypothetical protein CIP107562_01912 [Corynebacterium diphtheriae]CAB0663031.1 hypothetical protein CIP107580_01916 [Corynebacterium diphtheriae]CAB0664486.1 hypothetical protein CIP107571_02007 [Corynebacterium diphtheriae]
MLNVNGSACEKGIMVEQKVTRGAAACVAGCLALIPQPLVLAQDVPQPPAVVREEQHDQRLHNAITGVALLKQQGQGFAPLSPDAKLRGDEELGVQINWHTDSAVKPGAYFVYQIPSTLVLGGLTHFDINKLPVTFNDYLAVHSATVRGAITITAPLNYVAKRDHGYTTISLGEFGTHKLKVKPAQPSEPKPLVGSAAKNGEKLVVDSTESTESPESTTPTSTPNAQPQGWPDDEPWNDFDDDSVLPLHDGSREYPEDALIDDSHRPETPPEMIARSKQPATQPEKPQPLDPEAPAVLAREQEAVRDVPRNAGRVIERPRSIIEMLFPSRDKNRDKQNSEASQTSESSVAPTSTSAAASESVTQGASSTNIQPASGVSSATGTASVIPGIHKPTEDPKSRELIAGADHHHHDTEDDSVAMDDRHEIRQMQGDALGGQPVAAILINLAALAIMIGGAFLLLRLR